MRIKHVWSVLCKESVINKDDNLVSLYGALEELSVTLTPKENGSRVPDKVAVPINYEIVSLWTRDVSNEITKVNVEYILVSPEGDELLKTVQEIEFSQSVRRFRSRMKIAGMPITKQGDYVFKIKVKEPDVNNFKLVAELPLEVKIKFEGI